MTFEPASVGFGLKSIKTNPLREYMEFLMFPLIRFILASTKELFTCNAYLFAFQSTKQNYYYCVSHLLFFSARMAEWSDKFTCQNGFVVVFLLLVCDLINSFLPIILEISLFLAGILDAIIFARSFHPFYRNKYHSSST